MPSICPRPVASWSGKCIANVNLRIDHRQAGPGWLEARVSFEVKRSKRQENSKLFSGGIYVVLFFLFQRWRPTAVSRGGYDSGCVFACLRICSLNIKIHVTIKIVAVFRACREVLYVEVHDGQLIWRQELKEKLVLNSCHTWESKEQCILVLHDARVYWDIGGVFVSRRFRNLNRSLHSAF